jgi:two-component system, sporulation sensor kinase A
MQLNKYFNGKIFAITFALSALWIVGSDYVVHFLIPSIDDPFFLNMGKGLGFVFFTSLLVSHLYIREHRQLLNRKTEFERFFTKSPVPALIFCVTDDRILEINQSALSLLELEKHKVIQQSLSTIGFDFSKILLLTKNNGDKGVVDLGIEVILLANGERLSLKLTGFEVSFVDSPCLYLSFMDITKVLEAEETSAVNSKLIALGEVATHIAHEIKNPLSIMSIVVSKVTSRAVNADANWLKIDESINRINQTVSSLQRISRLDYKEAQLFDIRKSVDDALVLSRGALLLQSVEVFVELPEQEMLVYGRYSEIVQVLLNLFKNASDAMQPMDTNWLRVSGSIFKGQIELRVSNSGPLIEQQHRPHIFKKFYTTKGTERGTGLGLPLSLKIIKEHLGSFYLDDQSAHTTFIIRLPLSTKNATRSLE